MRPVNPKTVLGISTADLVTLIVVVLFVLAINTVMWIILF